MLTGISSIYTRWNENRGKQTVQLGGTINICISMTYLSVVEALELSQGTDIVVCDKVNGNTLATETTTTTNTVNVVLLVGGQVIVNDE